MQLCEYGCGKPAEYQFKNGKWCCSKTFHSCVEVRKENKLRNQGTKHSKETKKKMSNSQKGRIVSKETRLKLSKSMLGKPSNMLGKHHSEETKKKISESNKGNPSGMLGKHHSEETKKKISESNTGKKMSKEYCLNLSKRMSGINHPMYGKHHSKETKKKMSKSAMGQICYWKGKHLPKEVRLKISKSKTGQKHSEKSKKKMSDSSKGKILSKEDRIKQHLSIEKIKDRYPLFSKIEEMRYNPKFPNERIIQAHCKNHDCKNSKEKDGWFNVEYIQLYERIRSIENIDGNGGGYLYCSKDCKNECPLYHMKGDPIKKALDWYTTTEYNIWRNQVFKLDKNLCVYCEQPATIAHHILPQKTHPELSLDPENGLSVCEKCHFKYGHNNECSTGYLSKLICDRITRKKNKHIEHNIKEISLIGE